ncbi:transcriptional activator NhaR [Methylotenera mobilis]|uniref:Transcriptional regulator, LysR family n=1 Tax=Methylotenera mobilis (strain JLW8 / ATCC BAA-1282 / DSM 17540) TaxID=583345 RepID=C6WY29_METML|nr:transcriptional activator NhaR [Methylotenera mobilis]ACT46925.1 transcriptional regulator, LysR family [Methylotenera mobilis JLW8]
MINYKQFHYFWATAKAGSIVKASKQLHLTPQTISGQIAILEASLGVSLFRKVGRGIELTETGELALTYADDIFQTGNALEEMLRAGSKERSRLFRVGISDAVPKSIAYHLLAPAMSLAEPIKIICREGKLESLLGELAIHRLDLVLSDRPMPSEFDIKGRSNALMECGLSFFAANSFQASNLASFPHCLNNAPLLVPGEDSAVRKRLMLWLNTLRIQPQIVGEFDDSALMRAFGQAGVGIFCAPSIITDEVISQHNVTKIGETNEVVERFYAISVERRANHPAVVAINTAPSKIS